MPFPLPIRVGAIALVVLACTSTPQPPVPSNRVASASDRPQRIDDHFEGVIADHHFSIVVHHGELTAANRDMYSWSAGAGRVVVQDSGPVAAETRHLVARSPRTIVRDNDGLWVVTEVVTTADRRVFTCLHQQAVERDGSREAKRAAARGVAACGSLRVDPRPAAAE